MISTNLCFKNPLVCVLVSILPICLCIIAGVLLPNIPWKAWKKLLSYDHSGDEDATFMAKL